MGTGFGRSKEGIATLESGGEGRLKDSECTHGPTGTDTRGSGRSARSTARELNSLRMEINMWENTRMGNQVARGSTSGQMAPRMKDSSRMGSSMEEGGGRSH